MIPIVAIGGTWSFRPGVHTGAWYHQESAWSQMMQATGFRPACDRAFIWSAGLDGILPWRKHALWMATAAHLYDYLVPPFAPASRLPPAHTHIIAHSHALQPVMMAAAWFDLKIQTLTSIGSPIRGDVPYARARLNIRHWQHVHSDGSDLMQVLGGIGDAVLGVTRGCADAHRNVFLPDVGHSRILHEPALFDRWGPLLDTIRRYDGHE